MSDPGTPKVRLEISRDRPEDSPSRLAFELAEALNTVSERRNDCELFKTSAAAERTKASQMQDVIFQLKERRRNNVVSTSRMDPLNEYDLDSCEAEFALLKARAQEMQEKSDTYDVEAKAAKLTADKLQRRLHEINSKLRNKDAGK